jgi:DNA-binding transcriptional ArsR family regulator
MVSAKNSSAKSREPIHRDFVPNEKTMTKDTIDVDRLFRALGDATRRAILDRLVAGPTSVSRLADPLGITLTAVMQHLQILEGARLVYTEKLGRVRTCRIETTGFRALEQWIRDHRTGMERKLDRLGELLIGEDFAREDNKT